MQVEIGMSLNRDPSTVPRVLVEKPKECPRGHGPLRRDGRYAVCTTCGHEEPLGGLPTEDPGKGKYADKPIKLKGHGQGFRYPEDTKRQAVRDIEGGADKEEVCQRVGCVPITLDEWIAKYGEKSKVSPNLKALKEILTELRRSRFDLLRDASVLNSRIEAIEEAINILEEANEK